MTLSEVQRSPNFGRYVYSISIGGGGGEFMPTILLLFLFGFPYFPTVLSCCYRADDLLACKKNRDKNNRKRETKCVSSTTLVEARG